jgi:hypothetical protein
LNAAAGDDSRFPTTIRVTSSSQLDNATNVGADVPGMTGISLEANTFYRLEFYGIITSGAGGYRIILYFSQAQAATGSMFAGGTMAPPSMGAQSLNLIPYQAGTGTYIRINERTEAVTNAPTVSFVIFKTGANAPTVKLQMAQNASHGSTTSLLIGALALFTKL